MPTRILWGKLKKRDILENVGVGDRIILKSILKEQKWRTWTEFIWLRIGRSSKLRGVANTCECGNEISGSINRRKCLGRVKNSVVWS
jgi:hypothetical protein